MDVQGGRDEVYGIGEICLLSGSSAHTQRGGGLTEEKKEGLKKACRSLNISVCPVWRNGKPRSLARSLARSLSSSDATDG